MPPDNDALLKAQKRAAAARNAQAPRTGGGMGLGALVAVVLLGAGGAVLWPDLQARFGGVTAQREAAAGGANAPAAEMPLPERMENVELGLNALSLRLDMFDQRLRELELRPAAPAAVPAAEKAADPAAVAKLADDIAVLRAEYEGLRKLGNDANMAAKLSGVVEKTEAAVRRMTERQQMGSLLLLAVGHLREAVDRGGPFEGELQAALLLGRQRAPEQLAVLVPHAKRGVPTRIALADRFHAMAGQLSNAAGEGAPMSSWASRVLGSAVVVKRSDGVQAGMAAIAVRAEKLLGAGDLASAVQVLGGIPVSEGGELAVWLQDAQARLACDQAVSALAAASIAFASATSE